MINDMPDSEDEDKPNRLTQFLHEQALAAKRREDDQAATDLPG